MKLQLILIGILLSYLICSSSLAQPRLDSLYKLAAIQSVGSILVNYEDCIVLIGYGTNDTPFNSYGTIFSKFDPEGNLKLSAFSLDTNKFRQYNNMNAIVLDSFLYTTFTGSAPYQLLKFNLATGLIESRRALSNQIEEELYFQNYSVLLIDSNNVLINSSIQNTTTKLVTQLSIYHISEDTFSYFHNGYLNYDQIITKVTRLSNGYILSGYVRSGDPSDNEYTSRATLVWLDNEFNEIQRYLSSSGKLEGLGYDFVLQSDSVFVSTNCTGHQIDPGIGHGILIPVWRPSIYSVNSDGQLLWQTEMGYDLFGETKCIFNAIIPSFSFDGYIAVGSQSNFDADEYYDGDTLSNTGEKFKFEALIAKVSNNGDSLWSRHFYASDFLFSNSIFYDIQAHTNGGYIITGRANKHPIMEGETVSYTWLLSIDEYGCIVPGCHEVVQSNDPSLPISLKLYPNPVQDILFVYHHESELHNYAIINNKGVLIKEFEITEGETTYMLDVQSYTPGLYYILKSNSKGSSASEKWIKM